MRKYLYIIKNALAENTLQPVSLLFSIVEPLILVTGYILIYSYVENSDARINEQTIIYFTVIFVINAIYPKHILSDIKKDFDQERFLLMGLRPLNPFFYYLFRSLGRNIISFTIAIIVSIGVLVFYNYSVILILLYLLNVLFAVLLTNLIYFGLGMLRFRLKYFSNVLLNVLINFLSGRFIPIKYFPVGFLMFLNFLPFIYAGGQSARHLSEKNVSGLLIGIAVISIWSIFVFVISMRSWYSGIDYYQEKM